MAIVRREEPSSSALARPTREWDPFQTMRDLMHWDPFVEMTPRLWRGTEALFVPAFEVRETKDGFVFKADLPGFKEPDIDISLTGNRLNISGKRESESTEESDTYYCSERSYGSFNRSFTLPDGIDPDQIEAELKDGVLSLKVQKKAEAQPKKVSLRAGGRTNDEKKPKS